MGKRTGERGEPDNIYQRPNGIWYGRATVRGKEHRKSLQTRNRAEAVRRRAQWLKELSPYHGTIRHTYMEAVAEWVEAGQWKPKTFRRYAQSLGILEPYFGRLFWDQVNKAALQQFQKERRAAGASVATINRDLTVISGIAKHVRELDGWPDDNPVERLPRTTRRPKRWIYIRPPERDIDAIFARMKGTFGELSTVALESGLRLDELRLLERENARHGGARLYDQKNGLPSVVPWTPKAQAIVERQPVIAGSPYVFNTRNGGPYKRVTEMWREVVDRAQKAAQEKGQTFTRMRFHDLRHEFAIRYLENGGSLYRLKELLRHGTIGQTERYLNYLTPEQKERAMKGSAQ